MSANHTNPRHLIFIFLDGFGLGDAVITNPLYINGIPALEKISGEKLINGIDIVGPGMLFKGIDATLGVEGLPQSATGQTALFTGQNASGILGFHLPAFPNQRLIELVKSHNILKKLADAGFNPTFANAYTDNYFERAARLRDNMHSVTTHCMLTSGLQLRKEKDLLEDNAVYWDITREYLHTNHNPRITPIDPFCAGEHLAQISNLFEFVLFESFATDMIGHKCDSKKATKILEVLNSFLNGLLQAKSSTTNLVISSDHGNIEDLGIKTHTTNKVPLIVIGPDAHHFKAVKRIDQVTPSILDLFGF